MCVMCMHAFECVFTCFYLRAEDVSQNILVDVMDQDEAAVVREDVLLKLLQLLHTKHISILDTVRHSETQ